jgi:iron complex transport system ATP-binding protein
MKLQARGLHFRYTPGSPVVQGVSLELARGSMGALIGPNGCGKSTLIRLLAGLLVPSEGDVLLDGVNLRAVPREVRSRKLAYVPQSTAKAFPFTALEVVLTGRSPHLPRYAFEGRRDAEKAHDALETTGIAHLASRPITELSGGERQLVSVARALAQEPECILLDEPAASLDLKHRAALLRTLASLRAQRGLTVIMVTHDLSLIEPGFDAVYAMAGGKIAAAGPPSTVLQEALLSHVYEDQHVRVQRTGGHTFIWSEV